MKSPCDILAAARNDHNLSFREMAAAVGISSTRYHQIEVRGETPSIELAGRIIEFLEITGDDRKNLCRAWGKDAADQAAAWASLAVDDSAQAA